MVSSGMLQRMALVRADVSEELSASFIRVTRIDELGTTLAVTSNRCTLRRKPQILQYVGMYFKVNCSSECEIGVNNLNLIVNYSKLKSSLTEELNNSKADIHLSGQEIIPSHVGLECLYNVQKTLPMDSVFSRIRCAHFCPLKIYF
jgi:hypothetical protein